MDSKSRIPRREFPHNGGLTVVSGVAAALGLMAFGATRAPFAPAPTEATYKLTIQPTTLEIAPGMSVKTVAYNYNGEVPGPILRFREGIPAPIEVTNSSLNEDLVHWHGLEIYSLNDACCG